jgi:hypothetical protein
MKRFYGVTAIIGGNGTMVRKVEAHVTGAAAAGGFFVQQRKAAGFIIQGESADSAAIVSIPTGDGIEETVIGRDGEIVGAIDGHGELGRGKQATVHIQPGNINAFAGGVGKGAKIDPTILCPGGGEEEGKKSEGKYFGKEHGSHFPLTKRKDKLHGTRFLP